MKYLDEYRDSGIAHALAGRIRARVTRHWALMEICGGQTHTIMRYGLPDLLPEEIELVHGPGCPVCVARSNSWTEPSRSLGGRASSSSRMATCCVSLAPAPICST